ncbi:MAG: lycopene cyclase domain-containing protein [Bacteroidota bacterium]
MRFLYLSIDLFSIAGPFLLSFDKRVAFYTRWKPLFLSIFLMMLVFIPWDILKTAKGVWGFNPKYLCGIYFFNLPIEECLFFVCIPYACIFIYECLNHYVKIDFFKKFYKPLLITFSFFLLITGLLNISRWYPSVTFPYSAILLFVMLYILNANYLSRFFFAYLITLIPFLFVNGILTGSFISEPIVWYSSKEILNIRIGTIPIEDTIYNLGMLSTVIIPYEYFKLKFKISKS